LADVFDSGARLPLQKKGLPVLRRRAVGCGLVSMAAVDGLPLDTELIAIDITGTQAQVGW